MTAVCGALSDGGERYPRPAGELCECKDGWGGINCNGELRYNSCGISLSCAVCKDDDACSAFKTRLPGSDGRVGEEIDDMVCYKGGLAVEQNFQMCDVTSESSRMRRVDRS